jgi:hypothetical protein
MEKFEGDFIKKKYWDKEEFRDATEASAHRTEVRTGESVPNTPYESIENYLDRFAEIIDSPDPERKERGLRAIERLIERKYIIKPENITDEYIKKILFGNEAEMLGYNRNVVKTNSEISKVVTSSLESRLGEDLESYNIPSELRAGQENMIIEDQRSRMKAWLDELTGEGSSEVPLSFRYWAFAEMLKQGDYDPVGNKYNKRTDATVANFPELDPQALALVFDEVVKHRKGETPSAAFSEEEKKQEFEKLLKTENFGKLYAFMQEHVRSLKSPEEGLENIKGEWKLFPKGSPHEELTDPLQNFQTKWCIAGEGYAKSYLSHSDMWVYFSEDANGQNTIPRACIVDNESQGITEVRGIVFSDEVTQHLDSYIAPVVQEKLQTIPSGEKLKSRMEDMSQLSALHLKHLQGKPFDKDDLKFLYEIDRTIQGTGNGKDPRIAELRKGRNTEEDMLVIFECTKYQIANTPNEITENTKAYVGQLEPGIFQKLPETLEHIYTSFPEKKIRRDSVEIGGKSKEQLIAEMESSGISISDYAKSMMENPDFTVGANREEAKLVRLAVADLGFKASATTDQVFERAQALGLELCPPDTGPNYRLKYKDQPLGEYVRIGMKQITDSGGHPDVFSLARYDGGLGLGHHWAEPDRTWNADYGFVFRFRKVEA